MLTGAAGIFAVGLTLGLLGAGGSAIALPVLVYIVGMDPHQAVAFSLLLVGGVSAYGTFLHARRGLVQWSAALAFAPFGVAGAALGSSWSYLLSGRALLLMFSGLLAVIAIGMLLEKHAEVEARGARKWHWIAVAGFGIGVVTGLLGVGGGFVVVPAMVYCAGLAMRQALATSLVVIALNSLAAFTRHAAQRPPEWKLAVLLTACAAAGMTAGVFLSHRTEPARLKRGFACLLLGLAAFMTWRNV
ncbi:MAG: sulfite exporter TauE/SafE family protein [Candidatus Solibacter usitatus]|nr:sulfite exporter TauE/SafE family protein [Candidatus Solibacter usitatus]